MILAYITKLFAPVLALVATVLGVLALEKRRSKKEGVEQANAQLRDKVNEANDQVKKTHEKVLSDSTSVADRLRSGKFGSDN